MTKSLYITIMAGGQGKRMMSELPKVLHKVNGEAMIVRLIREVLQLNPEKILIVVGKFKDQIKTEIEKNITIDNIEYVDQIVPLGTGDAIKCTLGVLSNTNVNNLILNGDVPLIRFETINEIYQNHLKSNTEFTITSIDSSNPTGSGRIIIDNNIFQEIIEEKDCTSEQRKINLINCGIYICCSSVLHNYIPLIDNNNVQKEYYLTDLVKIYRQFTQKIINLHILSREKEIEIYNINTREQLEFVENYLRSN